LLNFFSFIFAETKFSLEKKFQKLVPVKMLSIISAVGLKGYALSGNKNDGQMGK